MYNSWHRGNASTVPNKDARFSSGGCQHTVRGNQCPNKENPRNTGRYHFLALRRRSIHPRGLASRCQISESSRNPFSYLPFRGVPVRKTNFSRLSEARTLLKNSNMPVRWVIFRVTTRQVRPDFFHGADFLGKRHFFEWQFNFHKVTVIEFSVRVKKATTCCFWTIFIFSEREGLESQPVSIVV